MRFEDVTGLSKAQLAEPVARVHARVGGYHSGGRGYCVGLYRSVALVVFLLRENPTQTVAAGVFGVSQSTVSRRWDALRELIATVLADMRPDPAAAARDCTVLVDCTLARTWDWACRTDLYSGKHRDTGFNLQIATTLTGRLLAVGTPIPGARHDAHAWAASGLRDPRWSARADDQLIPQGADHVIPHRWSLVGWCDCWSPLVNVGRAWGHLGQAGLPCWGGLVRRWAGRVGHGQAGPARGCCPGAAEAAGSRPARRAVA